MSGVSQAESALAQYARYFQLVRAHRDALADYQMGQVARKEKHWRWLRARELDQLVKQARTSLRARRAAKL